ncbi:MAG: DUF2226 domain-containing protein [Methanobacterium sp.]|jgi:hypothetical protein|uniref:DUF2226 domain-containing protein n=1 Tax=Methanobacterium subterraneum TaxID=59277 RepID=A0A2H4VQ26_9EURY|nr:MULTISPECIES: DUF2226 domain-containing protein [Methanobacterium]AUB60204.1 hypothetical protein BK009_05615 [Methanobacterium subterraneum]MCC7560387.1 DUF2226 domain-containing protein [Methanobacterium sp.]
MEMPITKPSMVSYADELDFSKLMEDLAKDHKNGFIRVTSSSEEGYILYKDGKQVAASYERYSKREALEKINSALDNKNTLIEVFDVGPSQVDYLLDLNKPYTIETDSVVYDVIGELKKKSSETSEESVETVNSTIIEPEVQDSDKIEASAKNLSEDVESVEKVVESSITEKTDSSLKEQPSEEPIKELEMDEEVESSPSVGLDESVDKSAQNVEKSTLANELETSLNEPPKGEEMSDEPPSSGGLDEYVDYSSVSNTPEESVVGTKSETPLAKTEIESESSDIDDEIPVDRSELLKKYGIKDVQDDDVENLLQSYSGGIIDDDDVERVELVLMNLIKKSVLGIPKIKGTEVMVFLDNYKDLSGTINIITEYESQGFLNRIMGQNRTAVNLRRQIINIAEIAIKKSFRQYPEVVERFEINVEFS